MVNNCVLYRNDVPGVRVNVVAPENLTGAHAEQLGRDT